MLLRPMMAAASPRRRRLRAGQLELFVFSLAQPRTRRNLNRDCHAASFPGWRGGGGCQWHRRAGSRCQRCLTRTRPGNRGVPRDSNVFSSPGSEGARMIPGFQDGGLPSQVEQRRRPGQRSKSWTRSDSDLQARVAAQQAQSCLLQNTPLASTQLDLGACRTVGLSPANRLRVVRPISAHDCSQTEFLLTFLKIFLNKNNFRG
jgi:hypothetical protein